MLRHQRLCLFWIIAQTFKRRSYLVMVETGLSFNTLLLFAFLTIGDFLRQTYRDLQNLEEVERTGLVIRLESLELALMLLII